MSSKPDLLPMELELRLAVPEKWFNRLKRLPLLVKTSAGRARTSHLKSTYFDTPDKQLAAAGMNLRIREIGNRKLQTLKVGNGWQAGSAPISPRWISFMRRKSALFFAKTEYGSDYSPFLSRISAGPVAC